MIDLHVLGSEEEKTMLSDAVKSEVLEAKLTPLLQRYLVAITDMCIITDPCDMSNLLKLI